MHPNPLVLLAELHEIVNSLLPYAPPDVGAYAAHKIARQRVHAASLLELAEQARLAEAAAEEAWSNEALAEKLDREEAARNERVLVLERELYSDDRLTTRDTNSGTMGDVSR